MMSKNPVSNPVRLIFPHQLFIEHMAAPKNTIMLLVEDDLFFKQLPFHKQKLMLHRASMRHFKDDLNAKGYAVEIIETSSQSSMESLLKLLVDLNPSEVSYFELTDDWLQRRLTKVMKQHKLQALRLESPGFLTSLGLIDDFFDNNPNRMKNFYEWQRQRLNIMVKAGKPVGGQWSFDEANRKKLPKNVVLPPKYAKFQSDHIDAAQKWVEQAFTTNPGNSHTFQYPVTHAQASDQLDEFIRSRLVSFGPYEDAIAQNEGEIFHSVLSPLLNIGLLTPGQIIDEVLRHHEAHPVPIESLEGFVRQIIGWREYMRATYIRFGGDMRTRNHLQSKRQLSQGWWQGSVGILPIDTVITRVLSTGYAHHIERLMILGNSMVLLRIDPNKVYDWFMAMFIDAYDWVMVPNVYAMSQFAAGELITTKPYISGSNYIIKMSDYTKGDWSNMWDALYWQFVHDNRQIIEKNYRTRMVISLYDRFPDDKKQHIATLAKKWLS